MSARGSMTHRAVVERSATQPDDDWGKEGPPVFASVGTIACRAWSKTRREVRDDGKEAVVEDMRALVPSVADIEEGDRVTITDRLGVTLFGGPVAVETIIYKREHREAMLRRHV